MTTETNPPRRPAPKPEWPTYEAPPLWYVRPFTDTFGSAA